MKQLWRKAACWTAALLCSGPMSSGAPSFPSSCVSTASSLRPACDACLADTTIYRQSRRTQRLWGGYAYPGNLSTAYEYPDSIALTVPEVHTRSARRLAEYLSTRLETEEDLVRGIYIWIARNIEYSVYADFQSRNVIYNEKEDVQQTLDERNGVCRQYALLFRDLCSRVGIACQTIQGYNRNGEMLLPTPHEWCMAMVDGQWYLFDPTWGAGTMEDYTFTPLLNDRYFMLSSAELLATHMPFDPMWQMCEPPLTYEQFDAGASYAGHRFLSTAEWEKKLAAYLAQDSLARLEGVVERMKHNPGMNKLVENEYLLLYSQISTLKRKQVVDRFNEAQDLWEEAVDLVNSFIRYRKNGFKPVRSRAETLAILSSAATRNNRAAALVDAIQDAPDDCIEKIGRLKQRIDELAVRIEEEKKTLKTEEGS